jgi:hypothetical protein
MKRLKVFGGVSVIVSAAVRVCNESDVTNAASVKNPSFFLRLHVPIILFPFLSLLYPITFIAYSVSVVLCNNVFVVEVVLLVEL